MSMSIGREPYRHSGSAEGRMTQKGIEIHRVTPL